ncbi:Transcriptional regulator [Fructilactobacillus florum 8D]|uniref:Cys-tRNA(Pro)/Cys-tRNA(Cys) deacylase n=1 Tax=Fructilactobacillus florum 8D TaxID=1221538 RepID=W9EF64_9LACO|nr:YbaK/EbsC family protein [Fructilactobacillus florum]EKK21127.1 Transcriptional regulator [Fructilactobacillus florum 2F]ETO40717.1 Transcriptional regulator [Fructilactobacillus florum 8D]
MTKKNHGKLHKTLVEQVLDQHKIKYQQIEFATHQVGDVFELDAHQQSYQRHQIYKTLAAITKDHEPIIGVVPLDCRLSLKKLARAADKKKVQMIPLKDLAAITTFEHGANTPVGIYEKKGYPIYFDCSAQQQGEIIISSGQIGRSVLVNAEAVAKLVHGSFADLIEA